MQQIIQALFFGKVANTLLGSKINILQNILENILENIFQRALSQRVR
jgi:hypothetical protein